MTAGHPGQWLLPVAAEHDPVNRHWESLVTRVQTNTVQRTNDAYAGPRESFTLRGPVDNDLFRWGTIDLGYKVAQCGPIRRY